MKPFVIVLIIGVVLFSMVKFLVKEMSGIYKDLPAEFYHLRPYKRVLSKLHEDVREMTWEEYRELEWHRIYYEEKIVHYATKILQRLKQLDQMGE